MAELFEICRECEDLLVLGPLARATEEMVLSDLRLSEEEGGPMTMPDTTTVFVIG